MEDLREYYQKNIYGIWRQGECVTYECLGPDPKKAEDARNPFDVTGGDLVRISVNAAGRKTGFLVHVYQPEEKQRLSHAKGAPFIICMHPITSAEYALSKGYTLIVMEIGSIASDDTKHRGAFYDLYPYGRDSAEQTGVLMAWAWGASKVLDAVCGGLSGEYSLDPGASLLTGVSRWGKATAVCGAFDHRFRMVIPACSGAGGLALFKYVSEGKSYDLSAVGGPAEYTYGQNEPLVCLQSDAERGWFNNAFLRYESPEDIPLDQENLPVMAMGRDNYYFIVAACTGEDWVNAPAMWECYKKANAVYEREGLSDHLVIHIHREGHAVTDEDMDLITRYFDHMYYKSDNALVLSGLKTSVFEGQE